MTAPRHLAKEEKKAEFYLSPPPFAKAAVGLCLSYLGFMWFLGHIKHGVPVELYNILAGLSWISTIIIILIYYFVKIHRPWKQKKINENYTVHNIENEKFILYLRTFKSSGRLRVQNTIESYADRILLGAYWDFEFALSHGLGKEISFIALGDAGSYGSAKITSSDSEWKNVAEKLISLSEVIFIVPSSNHGTLWEIEHIAGDPDLLKKSIFIQAPRFYHWSLIFQLRWMRSRRSRWKKLTDEVERLGLNFPPFDKKGRAFTFDRDGRIKQQQHAYGFNTDAIKNLCKSALSFSNEAQKDEGIILSKTKKNYPVFQFSSVYTLIFASLWAIIFRTFLYEPYIIPAGSMKPTLLIGDYLFVSKYSYGFSKLGNGLSIGSGRFLARLPKRGDVAVFKLPSDNRTDYIKRIVGLPGDRIQVKGGVLFVNEVEVVRTALDDFLDNDGNSVNPIKRYQEAMPLFPADGAGESDVVYEVLDWKAEGRGEYDNTEIYVVPEDHVFAMGDNRDNSLDSRSKVGFVPTENLVGRAEIIFFSTNGSARFWEVWKWPYTIRYGRLGSFID